MDIVHAQALGRVPITILRLKGNFDSDSAEHFNTEARKAVEGGAKDILLDLSGVPFMSSVGIRSISTLYDLLHPYTPEEKKSVNEAIRAGTYKAPHLKLLAPTERVREMMHLVSLDWYMQIFSSEEEAISAF